MRRHTLSGQVHGLPFQHRRRGALKAGRLDSDLLYRRRTGAAWPPAKPPRAGAASTPRAAARAVPVRSGKHMGRPQCAEVARSGPVLTQSHSRGWNGIGGPPGPNPHLVGRGASRRQCRSDARSAHDPQIGRTSRECIFLARWWWVPSGERQEGRPVALPPRHRIHAYAAHRHRSDPSLRTRSRGSVRED